MVTVWPISSTVRSSLPTSDNQDILTILEPFLNRDEEGEKIFTSNADYLNRYTIFVNNGGIPCYDNETGAQVTAATNVRFFSNYRYTVYMPTDAAIEAAFAKGLPTWEEIAEYLKIDDATGSTTLEDEELNERGPKAAAMVTQLINFLNRVRCKRCELQCDERLQESPCPRLHHQGFQQRPHHQRFLVCRNARNRWCVGLQVNGRWPLRLRLVISRCGKALLEQIPYNPINLPTSYEK